MGDDPVGRLAHPSEIAVIVCSLYHNVPDVDDRDAAETIAVALDVIPTDRTVFRRLPIRELLPRGLPRSRRPEPEPAGVASLTRLVGEFLDELGLDRPHLAGNSLGGWIPLELAKQGRARSATGLPPAGFHNALEGRFQRTSLWMTARTARVLAPRVGHLMKPKLARVFAFGQYVARPIQIPSDDAAATVRRLAGAP